MAADGQLRCPTGHPDGGNPRPVCAIGWIFQDKNGTEDTNCRFWRPGCYSGS